jgi:apolipoprotein N-acyltransferase
MRRALLGGAAAALLLVGAEWVLPELAWLVCAPFAAAWPAAGQRRRVWRNGAAAGATFAVLFALPTHAPWLAATGERYFGLPPELATASAILLSLTCSVLFGAPLGVFLWRVALLPRGVAVLAAACGWSTWESLLVIAFPHYPWAALAATQAGTGATAALQAASVGGQAALSFLLAASGFTVGTAIVAKGWRRRLGWLAAAAAVALATFAYGALRLRTQAIADLAGRPCTIAAVDARIAASDADREVALATYERLGDRAPALAPDLIVWPESALARDPRLDPALRRRLQSLAARWQAPLLVGGPRLAWGPQWDQQQFNAMTLIPSSGPLVAYDKRALVPFAESWPWPALGRPSWLAAEEIAAGDLPGLLDVNGCAVGVLICFEAERSALARELAALGARALVIASNDAQLPSPAAALELRQARLRAVETGLPVLRTANRGESAAIDRLGRTTDRSADGVTALHAGPAEPAPAVRLGGLVVLALAAGAAISAVAAGLRPR